MAAIWEYRGMAGGWQPFAREINLVVETAYERREKSVTYSIRGLKYHMVYADWKQYRDDDAAKVRSVRRRPPAGARFNTAEAAPISSSIGGPKFGAGLRGFLRPEDEEIVFFLRKINLQRFVHFFHRQGARTVMDIKFLLDNGRIPPDMTLLDHKRLQDAVGQWGIGTFDDFNNMPHGEMSKGLPKLEDVDWKKWLNWTLVVAIIALVCWRILAWLVSGFVAASASTVAATASAAAVAPVALAADCIDEDAEVTKYDRSRKKIKDIKVGDQVLSYNKGRFLIKRVRAIKIGTSSNMMQLQYQKMNGEVSQLYVTPGHPLWVVGAKAGWAVVDPTSVAYAPSGKRLAKLQVGDKLLLGDNAQGEAVKILAFHKVNKARATYNLIVDGPGTFFANGILMHSGLPPVK